MELRHFPGKITNSYVPSPLEILVGHKRYRVSRGALEDDANADSIEMEIMLAMMPEAEAGFTCPLSIEFEVDSVVQTSTDLHFIATAMIPMRGINGTLPLTLSLNEECPPLTYSTDVKLVLDMLEDRDYGLLVLEISFGQAFTFCNFGGITKGYNIFMRYTYNFVTKTDGTVEKLVVDLISITRTFLATSYWPVDQAVAIKFTLGFTDDSPTIGNVSDTVTATILSNNTALVTEVLMIEKPNIQHFPEFIVLKGFTKAAGTDHSSLWLHYSSNGSYYERKAMSWEPNNDTYLFEVPKIISYYYFSAFSCSVICNVSVELDPLEKHITILRDEANLILRTIPFVLDGNLNICIDLPIPGDSPPMLWMVITNIALFNLTSNRIRVSIIGDNIECQRTAYRYTRVGISSPTSEDTCNHEANITFCKTTSQNTIGNMTYCDYQCDCGDLQCSIIHVIMGSADIDHWRLCELSIHDV